MDLGHFSNSLLLKSMWRSLHSGGTWQDVINHKYLGGASLEDLFVLGWKFRRDSSAIWKGFGKLWPVLKQHLMWQFGNGNKILVGSINMMGIWKNFHFPEGLKLFLNQKGIFYLSQLIVEWKGDIPIWKEKENLGLFGCWSVAWDAFLTMLRRQGICKMREGDFLRWADSKLDKGPRVNEIYSSLIEQKLEMVHDCCFGILWKVDVPIKMVIFLWLVMNDKKLTWRNLQ